MGQVLNWKPIAFIGVLSYSLYLWQQLFLNRNSVAWVNAFPQNLFFAVAAALGSYFLLEKPFLRLRHRLRA
jgi:peptidoglycan/LPS O-acetylase OafA/YrhL